MPTVDGKVRPPHLAKSTRIEYGKADGSFTVKYPAHRACLACLAALDGSTHGPAEWHKPGVALAAGCNFKPNCQQQLQMGLLEVQPLVFTNLPPISRDILYASIA